LRQQNLLATTSVRRQIRAMDSTALIARLRDHYVDQFRRFAERQRASCTKGASEVKLQLGDQSELFDRLYCADFVKNDGKTEIVELHPDNVLTFDPITVSFGEALLSIEHLQWNDVVLYHDSDGLPPEKLSRWFRQWFDPDDQRHDPTADLSGVVHSLLVQPGSVSIDFGTANPEAFWDILELIEGAGAKRIRVSSSSAEMSDLD
jgi:hypothetical protein